MGSVKLPIEIIISDSNSVCGYLVLDIPKSLLPSKVEKERIKSLFDSFRGLNYDNINSIMLKLIAMFKGV